MSNKTIEELENKKWDEPQGHTTYLIKTVHTLRKKKINEFQIEDLRIMIGQNEGLKHLLPIAIQKLKLDLFAEGDLYAGDLLQSVLNINSVYWKENKVNWKEINSLIENRKQELEERKIKFQKFYSL